MLLVNQIGKISGRMEVPGDKSISHRAVMLAAIGKGKSAVEGFLAGQDCLSTVNCFEAMGIEIVKTQQGIAVGGKGLHGLKEPRDVLDAGNSGTTMRLLAGILAGQNFFSVVTGDQSLRQRPMARIAEPLRRMGASIDGRERGQWAPLMIRGGNLQGMAWETPVPSAQIKSALLLAGLYASGETVIREPGLTRDHTERMLSGFGVSVARQGTQVTLRPGLLEGRQLTVPGDISSAAFFLVAAAALPGSHLVLQNVGLNPTRTGLIDVLREMGADIQSDNIRTVCGEEIGDLIVRGAGLRGVEVGPEAVPRLIDEIPILAVAAAVAEGDTRITGAGELRLKESNRLRAITLELRKMGARIEELPDGLAVKGPNALMGAAVASHRDHRIAMALAVAGLLAQGETRIADSECIDISFPGFGGLLRQVAI
ncbi:MAG TPA: 3-phosphoshikimate 1-carboxyvinyltransferase [Selenomonadales bacterium]|nr:3-phosphoshikimate 1-carboxyvinyltransferase [Selenomonadales bacterium]